jgi:hypothetical protein
MKAEEKMVRGMTFMNHCRLKASVLRSNAVPSAAYPRRLVTKKVMKLGILYEKHY